MDRIIEKTKSERLMKYWPYMAGSCLVLIVLGWLVFGNHAPTLRVNKDELTISDVCQAEFKDYVRTNGQVLPIQVVQIRPRKVASSWKRLLKKERWYIKAMSSFV